MTVFGFAENQRVLLTQNVAKFAIANLGTRGATPRFFARGKNVVRFDRPLVAAPTSSVCCTIRVQLLVLGEIPKQVRDDGLRVSHLLRYRNDRFRDSRTKSGSFEVSGAKHYRTDSMSEA